MDEEQATFKVTDRRLFNSDGSLRELTPDEKAESNAALDAAGTNNQASATTTEAAASPVVQPTATEAAKPSQPKTADVSPDDEEAFAEADIPDAHDPASFVNFAMSIASNAASALGMMEHPVTGKREVDLELGKHWIDVLGMLQQKTRGNLLRSEERILEGLLADLRMQFVSLTNAKPKAR